ncbi:hypothetical protein C0Q70_10768 [Pomacea canaliculata]|uniref:Sialate O-acetylesterase domain-containing protein n=1 Tax=Pomacea canaliculata TaxID=400727 RepID=A0A2T7P430_POMCA|nr:sialate O-acetylesterase-like [Pomacea canaliculata]PVD28182.1 hypothetical protein C0Q70_10768 [Pomacea canaliculata]
MVLQRGPQRAVLTGTASKEGDTVTAQIVGHGSPVTTRVQGGKWLLKLPAMTLPGPFVIRVSSSEGQVTLNDVLFGDVWLCSGQSNMELHMDKIFNTTVEVQKGLQYKTIRFFHVPYEKSNTPLNSLLAGHSWSIPTTQSLQSFSAVCWLFAEYLQPHLKYPIGLIKASWGGTTIEAWSPPEACHACPTVHHSQPEPDCCPHSPIVIWNAMIHPILSMTIFGTIWYQGEANQDQPNVYGCQMKQLMSQWRSQFNKQSQGETSNSFPFGYVQLAAHSDTQQVGSFPALRWAQTGGYGYAPNPDQPHAFMAVAMDLPDFTSPDGPIHPRDKQDVAYRLMRGALNVAYGHSDVTYNGPFPSQFHVTGSGAQRTVTIQYDNGRASLSIRDTKGFEVCCGGASAHSCTDQGTKWVDAPITSHQGSLVTISASGCNADKVLGLRYAWRITPCHFKQCAVYAADTSLPAPPYLTNILPS